MSHNILQALRGIIEKSSEIYRSVILWLTVFSGEKISPASALNASPNNFRMSQLPPCLRNNEARWGKVLGLIMPFQGIQVTNWKAQPAAELFSSFLRALGLAWSEHSVHNDAQRIVFVFEKFASSLKLMNNNDVECPFQFQVLHSRRGSRVLVSLVHMKLL